MPRNETRTERARKLRRQLTPAENILWKHLRGRQFEGLKFRRQHPAGPFFLDMACHECRLIIELDGTSHLGSEFNDAERTIWLEQHGWIVLRFWNHQVFEELDGILEVIYRSCLQRRQQG